MYAYNVITNKGCAGIFLTQKEALEVAKNIDRAELTFIEVYSSNQNRLVFALHKQVHKWANVTKRIKGS